MPGTKRLIALIPFRYCYAIVSLLILCGTAAFAQKRAKVFEEFTEDPLKSILPDFSYAGYGNNEKEIPLSRAPVFDVTTFGAVAGDPLSDRAAIEEAIRAAVKHGSGIVYFPAGRFLVNEDSDQPVSIVIPAGNIVFKGEGSGPGGTELFMKNPLPPANPAQMWTSPPMFQFSPSLKDKYIGRLSASAAKGTFVIRVKEAKGIEPGDWLMLRMQNNASELIQKEMGIHKADTAWTGLVKNGVQVKEVHRVKSIRNNLITLSSPLCYSADTAYKWEVYKFGNSREVGVEDINFAGNWRQPFVHHRSAMDDSGWTMIRFSRLTDSWIRNCRFTDVNIAATIAAGANISVLNCLISGNAGHEAICNNGATNVFLGNITDEAGMFHSVGTNGGSMNTVVWRCKYPAVTSFESHSSQPRNTLLDCVEGGLQYNRGGGSVQNMPNHMSNLILWNYKQTNEPFNPFDFWPQKKRYWRIPAPVIVGFHGASTTFIREQLQYEESTGQPVSPASLFEAQLERRLKKLPEWLISQLNIYEHK